MNRVGWITHPIYIEHDTGKYHPERPERLKAIIRQIKKDNLDEKLIDIKPYPAPVEWIKEIHNDSYIKKVNQACKNGLTFLDTDDCPISSMTYESALWAVGATLSAVDKVMDNTIDSAFCNIRPPGHHAEYNMAMGFCFFNNIAIAANYIRKRYNLNKVFILDWDVHHGNGTQHIFEKDNTVFYCSIHESPDTCYPGTGYAEEMGIGNGFNFTLNYPMQPFSSDDQYNSIFISEIIPVIKHYKPDFILISAGFDAHKDDPLAYINLTDEAYTIMTKHIVDVAKEVCDGRIISVLEGGYNLYVLGNCVSKHIKALLEVND